MKVEGGGLRVEGLQQLFILTREQSGTGYRNGFVACGQQAPAIGAAFGYEEGFARAEEAGSGDGSLIRCLLAPLMWRNPVQSYN